MNDSVVVQKSYGFQNLFRHMNGLNFFQTAFEFECQLQITLFRTRRNERSVHGVRARARALLFQNEDRLRGQVEHLVERNEMRMLVRELEDAQFVERVLDVALLDDFGGEDLLGYVFLRAFLHGGKSTAGKDERRRWTRREVACGLLTDRDPR